MKDLKAENANLEADLKAAHEEIGRLRARLERSIEMPCRIGDDLYWVDTEKLSVRVMKRGIKGIMYTADGWFIQDSDGSIDPLNSDYAFATRSVADARLKELEGKSGDK